MPPASLALLERLVPPDPSETPSVHTYGNVCQCVVSLPGPPHSSRSLLLSSSVDNPVSIHLLQCLSMSCLFVWSSPLAHSSLLSSSFDNSVSTDPLQCLSAPSYSPPPLLRLFPLTTSPVQPSVVSIIVCICHCLSVPPHSWWCGFFLACEDFGRMFDHSFPVYTFFGNRN